MEAFFPIAVLLVLSMGVCTGIFVVSSVLGPRRIQKTKLSPYECGVPTEGETHAPFKNKFYLIAVLFLLFDVEAAFFFPWALVYKESLAQSGALLIALLVYMGFLILGLAYVFKKKVLELA